MTLAAWAGRKDPKVQVAMDKIASLPDSDKRGRVRVPFPFLDRAPIKAALTNKQINRAIEEAPVADVPLKGLKAVQRSVDPLHAASYVLHPGEAAKPSPVPVDVPIVVKYKGRLALWDGHHRTTARWALGEGSVRARVADLDALLEDDREAPPRIPAP